MGWERPVLILALLLCLAVPAGASVESCQATLRALARRIETMTPAEIAALRADPKWGPALRRIEAELDRGRFFGPLAQRLRRQAAREGVTLDLDVLYARVLADAVRNSSGSGLSSRDVEHPEGIGGPIRISEYHGDMIRNETYLRYLLLREAQHMIFEAKRERNGGEYPDGWLTPPMRGLIDGMARESADAHAAYVRERWRSVLPLEGWTFTSRPGAPEQMSPYWWVTDGVGPNGQRLQITHAGADVTLRLTPRQMAAIADTMRRDGVPFWVNHSWIHQGNLTHNSYEMVNHLRFPGGRFPVVSRGERYEDTVFEVRFTVLNRPDLEGARYLAMLLRAAEGPR